MFRFSRRKSTSSLSYLSVRLAPTVTNLEQSLSSKKTFFVSRADWKLVSQAGLADSDTSSCSSLTLRLIWRNSWLHTRVSAIFALSEA